MSGLKMDRSSAYSSDTQMFYLELRPEAPVRFRRTRNLFYWMNPQPCNLGKAVDARHELAKKLGINPLDVTYKVI